MNTIAPAQPEVIAIETATLDQDALRAECRRIAADEGINLAEQARQIGLPYGTFTSWVGGTYKGKAEDKAAEVAKWFKARQERAQVRASLPAAPGFVATRTASHLMNLLTFAQTAPDIVVAAGGAGIGKTITCREYKAKNPNAYLATMRPTTSGVHTMLAEISEVMSIEERSANKLARAIGRKVRDTGALLIIDEAQHLASAALDEARSLHDSWGLGIALVGNETVYSRLEGQGRQSSLAQLYSRVGMRLTQAKPLPDDVRGLVAAWGITDPAMIKTLVAIAAKPGALRGMVKTIQLATMLAAGAGDDLSDRHVHGAWKQLGNQLVVE